MQWSWRLWPTGRSCRTAIPNGSRSVGGADSGEHEQHGRLVGAGGEDHLALGAHGLAHAVADELDADGAVALEDDPLDEDAVAVTSRFGLLGRRVQERIRRAAPHAVALRELEARDALRAVDVQVLDQLVAGLDRGLQLASISGLIERLSETARGPPTPWNSFSPRSLSSERLKYGSTSS